MSTTTVWPIAPDGLTPYPKAGYPPIPGLSLRAQIKHGTSGPLVMVAYAGFWLYLVPRSLWDDTPTQVRMGISYLYHAGWRTISDVLASNVETIAAQHGVGQRRAKKIWDWAHAMNRRMMIHPEWADAAASAIDSLGAHW